MSSAKQGSPARAGSVQSGSLRHLVYLRDLLVELIMREMKLRYERSLFGLLWAVVNPLAQLMVFVILFKYVIPLKIENYPLLVFTGVLAWNWTREGLMQATDAIVNNRDLIRQPGFPLALLPVVSLSTPLIDLLVALPVLMAFLVISGSQATWNLLWLPLLIALQFLLLLGPAYLVAASQVVFRDTAHLLNVCLMLGFYLTPVFYDASVVPDSFSPIYTFNPMTHMLAAYRSVIMQGAPPDAGTLGTLIIIGAVVCWLAHRVFVRASRHFAEEL